MSSIYFVDNDILLKLVACNLFYETINLFKINTNNLKFLPTVEKVIDRNRKIKNRYSSTIRSDAINIIRKCSIVKLKPEYLSNLKILESEDNIDPGEALLLVATLAEPTCFLMTGDKRFLRALANSPKLNIFYQSVKGRVICLELLIYNLIKVRGFKPILEKVIIARNYDTALKRCFGSGYQAEEKTVLYNLEEEIKDIQRDTKDILAKL